VSGYRIELGDVEAALQRLPGVRAAVTAIVPAPRERGGDMLAAVVGVDGQRPSVEQLRDGMAKLVPPHMIPRHFELLDSIPFTVGGKTDRWAAGQILAKVIGSGDFTNAGRQPSTPLESAIAAILAELLDIGAVGRDDDFFELGGDSVLATTAVARIRSWLDTPTAMVADIFATRTVSALAQRLTEREPDSHRLEQVAELYLEVADMDNADVMSALDTASTP
jgi:mycobactin phenyloxazoline synthetase